VTITCGVENKASHLDAIGSKGSNGSKSQAKHKNHTNFPNRAYAWIMTKGMTQIATQTSPAGFRNWLVASSPPCKKKWTPKKKPFTPAELKEMGL
jgi:hypothetical protein